VALFIWDKLYSVGVDELDADHILIASLINHIDDAKQAGTDETAVAALLRVLVKLAYDHFRREEAFLAHAQYPQLAPHIHEHRLVEEQLSELYDGYVRTSDPAISREIMELLNFWLVEHIMKVDMHYKPFVAAHRPV
jgi:hemerythrin-like metal-binding protein